jgi:hypothetical protein
MNTGRAGKGVEKDDGGKEVSRLCNAMIKKKKE